MSAGPGEGDIDPITGEVDIQGPDTDVGDVDGGGQAGAGPPGQIDVGDVGGAEQPPTGGRPGPQQTTQTGEPVVTDQPPSQPTVTDRGPMGAPTREPAGEQPDISSEQIARDVGAAIQRGELDPMRGVTASDRRRAIAEAKRERGGPAEPFRPDAPMEGSFVRSVGEDAFVVSLATPTGRESVPVAFAGPRTGPRNITGPREAVAPFEESEAEKIIDGGPVERLAGFERAETLESAAEELSEDLPGELDAEDLELVEEDGRTVAQPTEEATEEIRRRRVAELLDEETPVEIGAEDIAAVREASLEIAGGPRAGDVRAGVQPGAIELTEEIQGELAEYRDLAARIDLSTNQMAEQVGDVLEARAEARQELTAAVREDLDQPGFEAGEEFTIEREGDTLRAELTARGRQAAITSELTEQGFVETERPEAEVPLLGTIGGGTERIQVETSEQLVFDEEGKLVDVTKPPRATMTENVEEIERKLGGGALARAEAIGLAGSLAAIQKAGDVTSDVSESVGGAIDRRGALVAADPLATPFGAETTGTEGPSQIGFVEDTAGAKIAKGGAQIVPLAVGLPETVSVGAQTAGEAGAFTVEEGIGDAASAATGETVDFAEEQAVAVAQQPFQTAGTLAGSAVVFGGAAAVGPRTSLATRAAIQPGEELLGFGGAATLRGLPGSRTSRAADVLFPRNEPLIFSEEAAIRTVSRGFRGARAATQRARSAAGEATPTSRPRVTRPTVPERVPSISAEINPEAGFVEVDVPVREITLERPAAAVRSAGETVAAAPGRAARGAVSGARATPRRIRAGGTRVQSELAQQIEATQARLRADFERTAQARRDLAESVSELEVPRGERGAEGFDAMLRALETGAPRRRDVSGLPGGVRERAAAVGATARSLPGRAQSEIAGDIEAAQEGLRREFERTAQARRDVAEAVASLDFEADFLGETRVPTGQRGAEGFDAMLRALETGAPRRRDLPGRPGLSDLPDIGRPIEGVMGRFEAGPTISGDVALQQAFLRGSELPGPRQPDLGRIPRMARRGLEAANQRAERIGTSLAGRGPAVTGDVALQQAFIRGSELPGPRTPELPDLADLDLSDAAAGAFERADVARRRELSSLRFGLSEQLARGRSGLADLRDVTIRVGGERRSLVESGPDEPPIRFQGDMLGIESDTTVEPDESDFEPLDPTEVGAETESEGDVLLQGETGVAVQRVVEVEAEPEMSMRAEAETPRIKTDVPSPDLDERVGAGVGLDETVDRLDLVQEPTVEPITEPVGERERIGVETEEEIRTEVEPRGETEVEQEARTDVEQRLELETEEEVELELELELETEVERELEIETGDRFDPDDDRRDDEFDLFDRRFTFDVTRPGEVSASVDRSLDALERDLDDDLGGVGGDAG